MNIIPYKALALQTKCNAINSYDASTARQHMIEKLHRVNQQIKASKAFIGTDLKLVVLPEYFLTGFPMGESIKEWQEKGCIKDGDELNQLLSKCATENNIYLSGNAYELDKHFPHLYFQASFIFNNKGEKILNYRRLNSMYAPTPHDVLDKYISIYGRESLFPVADTELGKLCCIASEEIVYPEIVRCMVMNGAEVILHSTSEIGSTISTHKNIAKQARAIENMAYVISANSAGIYNASIPANSTDGHSQIVQYEGVKLVEAGFGESMVANASIHIQQLREHRKRPAMSNYLARQRNELFAPYYNQQVYQANTIDLTIERKQFGEHLQRSINTLIEKGIIAQ